MTGKKYSNLTEVAQKYPDSFGKPSKFFLLLEFIISGVLELVLSQTEICCLALYYI